MEGIEIPSAVPVVGALSLHRYCDFRDRDIIFSFSFIASAVSYFEPMMFGVLTALAIVSVLRRKMSNPRVIGKVLMTMFLMIASIAYVSNAERVTGLAFAAMALVWFCLSVHAGITKRLQRQERLAKLDRAVNSWDRAMRKVNGNEN